MKCLTPWDAQPSRIRTPDSIAPALGGADGGGGRNPAGLVLTAVHPDVTGTLCGSGAGMSRPAGMASEMDLLVACSVAAVDCRSLAENGETNGTLQAGAGHHGWSMNCNNAVRTGYVVRRLTPLECERLMGLPDGYTEFGHDGKQISDSARYQMCGNSIVVAVLLRIMKNIVEALRGDEKEDAE
jgi:DNA (cytosine-5)-methyltransferase 1